jgi:hypothetical protein
VTLEARLPLLWRGGGVMDGLIETWHELLGLPNGNRADFPRDRLIVRALDDQRRELRWPGGDGAGLGGLEVGARWSSSRRDSGWTGALDGRVRLPTGTAGFGGGGVQLGGQVLAARTLGRAADLYFGGGLVLGPRSSGDTVVYTVARPQGFLALEWRPWSPVSLLVEVNAAGRLIDNVTSFPGRHVNLRVGAKVDVARGWTVEGGFTEGLHPVSATTDFGVMAGVQRGF